MNITHEDYKALCQELHQASNAYYRADNPVMSDAAYDEKLRQVIQAESQNPSWRTPDSPSQRIGAAPLESFSPFPHQHRMESLDNVFTEDELEKFLARMDENATYVVEPKVDGIAVELIYENGIFVRGGTRGDGETGEDISNNLKTIRSLPLRVDLCGEVTLRGEVFMSFATFDQLNREAEEAGRDQFANPRNAAGGAIKQLDSTECAKRRLDIIIHGAIMPGAETIQTHDSALSLLARVGFPVSIVHPCSRHEVPGAVKALGASISKFAYPADGAVVKLNSLAARDEYGSHSKAPRWAVAYKFPPEQAKTKLKSVTLQVGRTGVITPVAELEPVLLAGSTISRATLHNFAEVKRLDVQIGDTVVIQKAGEIIPQIVSVDLAFRTNAITGDPQVRYPIEPPLVCPACDGAPVDFDGIRATCRNPNCTEQLKRRVRHFATKACMDIEGLGPEIVDSMVTAGLVKELPDLYRLTVGQVAPLSMSGRAVGAKAAQKLVEAIAKSKENPLWRLIHSLGIPGVGLGTAKDLEQHYPDIHAIIKTARMLNPTLDLTAVEGVGIVTAADIAAFFQNEKNHQMIIDLEKAGVNVTSVKKTTTGFKLSGQTWVITGTLSQSRDVFKDLIEQHGGKTSDSVSKKTTALLVGEDAGSKLEKARKLGVSIYNETEFNKLLSE